MSETITAPFGQDVIRTILPHREPFLLVDRVDVLEPETRIVCTKELREDEYFLRRVPGQSPTFPITLLAEVMAQAGGILVLLRSGQPGQRIYFASIEHLEMRHPVHPGDTLQIEAEPLRMRKRFGTLRGVARVEGREVAEGVMCFALGQPPAPSADE